MKCLIAINYVNYKSEYKKKAQETAISVLVKNKPRSTSLASINFPNEVNNVKVPSFFNVLPMLQNDSQKKIGNNRRMPYIKELFDICSHMPCDIFGYMNSDILVKRDFFKVFNGKTDAYVFFKKDIGELSADDFISDKITIVDQSPCGQDAFFFRREWWIKNRHFFPDDLILGETEWDTCYNSIIQKISKNYIIERSLYHINHERVWKLDSRGAINNTLIWQNIREKYGLPLLTPETRQS